MGDNLNTPVALAVLWKTINSEYPDEQKAATILKMDGILGLGLHNSEQHLQSTELLFSKSSNREKAAELAAERNILRNERKFNEADHVRKRILEMGFLVKDTPDGFELVPNKTGGCELRDC